MLNDSPTPKTSSFAERFQQLSQLRFDLPVQFAAKNDRPNVWDITNRVCDQHDILHMC